ncbi:MAG: DUF1893 domain-containing protein [Clostridia bacterium]|nr:DUF1893 domain-containing protein [Clostridia bacterium]
MQDLITAKTVLKSGDYTCVLCRGACTHTATARGVAPLLQWLEDETDLRGFFAADKVVGGAAAFLYVLLGVAHVHACVISARAIDVLTANGIAFSYDTAVPAIKNRTGDGFCPMERATASLPVCAPADALAVIKETLLRLKRGGTV